MNVAEHTLRDFLQAHRLHHPQVTGLVVALSAGPDSVALLQATARIGPVLGYRIRALHVHHGLHPDATTWASLAQAQAAAVSISCSVLRVSVPAGPSVEAHARQARYNALAAALAPDEALLLAHHQDDQAETLLLRLMRGAGLRGLAAMRSETVWRTATGQSMRCWRPWLSVSRAALAEARQPEADYVHDPANQDPQFDRTLLRHQVLPLLHTRWPQATGLLARSAAQLAAHSQALDVLSGFFLQHAGARAVSAHQFVVSRSSLIDLPDAALQAVMASWLQQIGAPSLPVRFVPRLRPELLMARADAQPCLSWSGWSLRRYRDQVYLRHDAAHPELPDDHGHWTHPRQPLHWAGQVWTLARLGLPLNDTDPRLDQPWQLMPRQGGEYGQPPDQSKPQTLKQWAQDRGIPPWQRDRYVGVWVGDTLLTWVPFIPDEWREMPVLPSG